jgi:CarD family transcriptional regulator
MTFQIGEQVVYPNQGIGTIENVSTRSFGTYLEKYYLLRLTCGSLTVMVPFSHVQHVGLRRVTGNGELMRVLQFLSAGTCRSSQDWKVRFRENSEKMRVGGLADTAQVLKGLLLVQRQKPLSFREKTMLDRARHMLVTELSASRHMTQAEATRLIESALAKASLTLPPPL